MADLRLVRPQTLFVTRYNYSTRCVYVHVCVQVCGCRNTERLHQNGTTTNSEILVPKEDIGGRNTKSYHYQIHRRSKKDEEV